MKTDRVMTPEEFLLAFLRANDAVRKLPSKCYHGISMDHPCKECLQEIDEILRVH